MDPKVIEMNNLRVLHDYLNQTLDVLARGQRLPGGHVAPFGYSPFSAPVASAPIGTDVVYGPSPYGFTGSPMFGTISPFAAMNPFGAWQQPWGQQPWGQQPWAQQPWGQQPWGQTPWTAGQTPWTPGTTSWPVAEAARQAQVNQALAAKQSVLEAMCRVAGIPV